MDDSMTCCNMQSAPAAGRRNLLLILLASIAARCLFLACVPSTAVSLDLKMWLKVAGQLANGANPYSTTTGLNWPPFWLQVLFCLDWLSQATSVPLYRVIQVFLIGAECLLIVSTYHLLSRLDLTRKPGIVVLWGIALNPICILQVCQHGNFDVLVGFWVMVTILMLVRFGDSRSPTDWLCACLFLGLGILTKTTPVVLLPVLLAGTAPLSLPCRLLGMALVFGPATLGLSVLFTLDPGGIWHHVLLYRSASGVFGISGILAIWNSHGALELYGKAFPWLLLTLLAATAIRTQRVTITADRILALSCLLLMIIPALGPGYAPQYVYWFLPLLLILAVSPFKGVRWMVRAFLITTAATYLVEYAINPDLGAFLVMATGCDSLHQAGLWLRAPERQTILRLPQFAAYLGTVLVLWRASFPAPSPAQACARPKQIHEGTL